MNRQTLTYELLGVRIGIPAFALGNHLGHVMHYCVQQKLPPLTALVVSKETGRPGLGFTATDDPDKAREQVFTYPWLERIPPSADDLKQAAALAISG